MREVVEPSSRRSNRGGNGRCSVWVYKKINIIITLICQINLIIICHYVC